MVTEQRDNNVSRRDRFKKLIDRLIPYVICAILVVFLVLSGKSYFKLKSEFDQKTTELNQANAEIAAMTDYAQVTSGDVRNRQLDVSLCVEPYRPLIRDIAVSQVAYPPKDISSNSEVWKIWQINYWAAHNIKYVSDPKGFDYFALASETMLTRAGDCEDFAILIASMYESVRLDACLISVDTDNDGTADHMSCLVYYSKDQGSFIDEERAIMDELLATSHTGEIKISYFEATELRLPQKYDSGIWVIIDPLEGFVRDMPGYINKENYHVMQVFDVGN